MLLLLACVAAPEPLGADALEEALTASDAITSESLMAAVEDLVDARSEEEGVVLESWDHPYLNAAAEQWIIEQLLAMGFQVQRDSTDELGVVVDNLYVDIPGSGAPDEIVLVSAHYDSWYLGADDNASAVAVLLEAARALPERLPQRTVRLMFFDHEETRLEGSHRYFRDHPDQDLVAMINLDAVGFSSDAPGSQSGPTGLTLPDTADFLGVLGNQLAAEHAYRAMQLGAALDTPLPTFALVAPGDVNSAATANFQRSDHAPAWLEGYPALFLTDTADFRNANYHTADDLPETLNPEFLRGVARVTVSLTLALANDP